jgi:hypothetical protein
VVCCCEHGDEHLSLVKDKERLDRLSVLSATQEVLFILDCVS